jgi:transcription antitermination protein NusB
MAIDRHQARILAMQVLCQLDVQGDRFLPEVPGFVADARVDGPTGDYANRLVSGVWRARVQIDQELERHMPGWSVPRLSSVDRNLLRVAIDELDRDVVPPKVVIDEAITIGQEYGTAESGRFINGVLDAVWTARRGSGEG